jgi:hypothetical protein
MNPGHIIRMLRGLFKDDAPKAKVVLGLELSWNVPYFRWQEPVAIAA